MAKVLRGDIRRAKYDWDVLLDGKTRELVQGKDFDVDPSAFRTAAYHAGRRNGVRVVCKLVEDDKVHLQAQPLS